MPISTFIIYAFVVASVTLTITKSHLFAWWRDWLEPLEDYVGLHLVHKLFQCMFCVAFWIALALMFLRPVLGVETTPDRIFYTFALMGCGSLLAALIYATISIGDANK